MQWKKQDQKDRGHTTQDQYKKPTGDHPKTNIEKKQDPLTVTDWDRPPRPSRDNDKERK
jgi:hypothetical protein